MKVNDRFHWAVATLEVQPSDHILEIGCGTGIALQLLAPLLKKGKLVGLDRSGTMIEKAAKKNEVYIQRGTLRLLTGSIETAVLGKESFTIIFAFNVNMFYLDDPAEALKVIRKHLAPEGKLLLFFQPPPGANQRILNDIADRAASHLTKNKFDLLQTVQQPDTRTPSIGIVAQPLP